MSLASSGWEANVVLASPVFFLVDPLTEWQAEQSLEVLCNVCSYCART